MPPVRAETTLGGPVSAALEESLASFVRKHGLVVWLDAHGHYTAFVDRLATAGAAGDARYRVRSFRGSHLEFLLSLEGLACGIDPEPLVLHLPGFNPTWVEETPCLELYLSARKYTKALTTLVTDAAAGQVHPELIEAYCGAPDLTLEAADAWLAGHLSTGETGAPARLRLMKPQAVLDGLIGGDESVRGLLSNDADAAALWGQVGAWFGLPASWREMTVESSRPSAEDAAFAIASWALCVEYVNDLKRDPYDARLVEISRLPSQVTATCGETAAHLRTAHGEFYKHVAGKTQALLSVEVERARAEDLGKIDTFRFEEESVLLAAIHALKDGDWHTAATWATLRTDETSGGESYWLRIDPLRRTAWRLIDAAARLGQAITRAGDRLGATESLAAAADAYAARGAAVDRAHRHLEQRRVAVLYPPMPHIEELRARLDEMRTRWRNWADAWSRDFNALCRRRGFLPEASRQQRTLFDDVVGPMVKEPGTTAYFVVDALRFEMAEELLRLIGETPATMVQLKARLAELPTVTEVGMNVLAPVSSGGRLRPKLSSSDGGVIGGFSTGTFHVKDPKTRKRAMHDRVGGQDCPWKTLDEVVAQDSASLRKTVARAQLLIVHSVEIDKSGENGLGPVVFDTVMLKLRAAWRLLRDAGVRRFVVTADHGFLLVDSAGGSAQTHGRKIDGNRRHVISSMAADHAGEVRVPLADLGYDGVEGHVMFPETTAVFETATGPKPFVHGGNSLQERVIPVLTLVHRVAAGGSTLAYRVRAEARDDVAGMHCLAIQVDAMASGELDFGGSAEVDLALRVSAPSGARIELCQARGNARLANSVVVAPVGKEFEVFFRLFGPSEAPVRVEVYHPSALVELEPCSSDESFEVTSTDERAASGGWRGELPDGARQVFEHLERFGTITETEAAGMLGGPRGARRFAREFDDHVRKVPFRVRIDVVANVKCYVREGGA